MPFPVNAILRGCAVLALLCLPRVSALTITQTTTTAVGGMANGSGAAICSAYLFADPFSAAGTLTSVSLSVDFLATASTADINLFGFLTVFEESLRVSSVVRIIGDTWQSEISELQTGGSVPLALGQSAGFSATFHQVHFAMLPLDLFLAGTISTGITPFVFTGRAEGSTWLGSTFINGTVTMSLVYDYDALTISPASEAVADSGGAAGLLVCAIGLIVGFHRRMNRNRPTL
jgi:hypothetical protein